MKQYPAHRKFKKYHRPTKAFRFLVEKRNSLLLNGFSGVRAQASGKLNYRQLEACRRALRRGLKKRGNVWIRPFTSSPVTKKPVASRMGKGKGSVSHWIAPVRTGEVLFEISEWDCVKAKRILRKASERLPMRSKIIFPVF